MVVRDKRVHRFGNIGLLLSAVALVVYYVYRYYGSSEQVESALYYLYTVLVVYTLGYLTGERMARRALSDTTRSMLTRCYDSADRRTKRGFDYHFKDVSATFGITKADQ